MRFPVTVVASLAVGLFATGASAAEPASARAELKDAKGQSLGTLTLQETPHGVLLKAELKGLPPGTHAFHVHETGRCEPPFKSAGGHFNPGGKKHGIASAEGMHGGDMPNIVVPKSGEVALEVLLGGVTLRAGPTSLLDADGSALVIHAGVDDYTTDPAGNAGDRIACGVIVRG